MLTPKQAVLLKFIKVFQEQNDGMSPSLDEMAAHTGGRSSGNIHRLLVALEDRGKIRRQFGHARAIEVLCDAPTAVGAIQKKLKLAREHADRGDLAAALTVTRAAAQEIEKRMC